MKPASIESKTVQKRYSSAQRIFILMGIGWTVIIAFVLTWSIKDLKEHSTETLLSQARSIFSLAVTTRYWNSVHGGVYVPITEETPPNPYLDVAERDIKTESGKLLTLINPAYMTRQISELASVRSKVQFHITSLKPIRPGNKAKPWEVSAMTKFLSKTDEYYEQVENTTEEIKQSFRYMAPLWTDRPCLACHAKQGYVEGDLRGGISVTIPIDEILASQDGNILFIVLAYSSLWVLGLSGIFMTSRITRKDALRQSNLIEHLKSALSEVKILKGFIPICASCKKIRNDDGYWQDVAVYLHKHSEAEFSHGVCPECVGKIYPDLQHKMAQRRHDVLQTIIRLGQATADDIAHAVNLPLNKTQNNLRIIVEEKQAEKIERDGQLFYRLIQK